MTGGFAVAVAMWIVGYLTHLPGVDLPPSVVGAVLLGVFVIGCALAARGASRPLTRGAAIGLVAAAVNLLVLGAILAEPDSTNGLRPRWVVTVLGFVAFSAVAAGAGAWVFARFSAKNPRVEHPADWLARFGVVACAAALPVLLSGGLVTSTNTGLAVPDWPRSYNANMFLYPLSRMTGGIYYEHAHRLFGSLVGLTVLVLFVFVLAVDRRRWVKAVAAAAFFAVCVQGVLGGIRVTSATVTSPEMSPDTLADNSRSVALALVHGTSAQLVFALLCALAALLSRRWRCPDEQTGRRGDPGLRSVSVALLIALVLQLVLGSMTRHMHSTHALITHILFAFVVLALALVGGFRASHRHADDPTLSRVGRWVAGLAMTQVVLGAVAALLVLPYGTGKADPPIAVLFATAHQATGALLLGSAALLFVWTRRLPASTAVPPAEPRGSADSASAA